MLAEFHTCGTDSGRYVFSPALFHQPQTDVIIAWLAVIDFALAILPWHVIMGLNMRRKEKLTVAFGLSLGVL